MKKLICATLLQAACCLCTHATDATWTGLGDGTNWSDTANWSPTVVPTNVATIPYPGAPRTVRVDVATSLYQLAMADGPFNQLALDADLTVDLVDHPADAGGTAKIDLNGNTLTVSSGSAFYFPKIGGTGTFVKVGAGQVTLNGEDGYTGSFTVTNGVLAFRCGNFSPTSMTVTNGGTARSHDVCATMPATIEIHGNGDNGRGAVEFAAGGEICASAFTVAADSKMKCLAGTVTLTGDILGDGILTLEGPGTLDIEATGISYTNKLIVTNGTTRIAGTFPDLEHILVDAGGVLEGLAVQFPNATVVETNGGVWIQNLNATWTGNGDGTNWSDTANWSPEIVPTNVATIPYPGAPRTVRVDVATNLYQLAMATGPFNELALDADLTVDLVDHPDDAGGTAKIDLNGNTLTVSSGNALYFPKIGGTGTFVKVGAGQVTLNGEDGYTGSFMVTNGVLAFRCGNFSPASMTVTNGGTARSHDVCATMPATIEIHGDGYTGRGAIEFAAGGEICASAFTVATDSKMKCLSGTVTLTGDILGDGILTLEGPGALEIQATGISYTNKLIVTNGTTRIAGTFPDLEHILVDAGGVLEGLAVQFPNATVVETNGGVWIQNLNATWTGNGDGTNWSDTANWSPEIVPTNVATIPYPGAPRTVRVDVATNLYQLAMATGPFNELALDADLTVDLVDHPDDAGGTAKIDLNGNTLTVSSGSALYFPKIGGAGTFVKVGIGQVTLNGEDGYTGGFTASNGVLAFRCGDFSPASMTVVNGGTARSHDVCATMPSAIAINGNGYTGRGAIEFAAGGEICASDITVTTDAKIECTTAATITLNGNIFGPGILTLEGTGATTLDLNGTNNYAISGQSGNAIIISNATVDISGCTLSLSEVVPRAAREFVIIDKSAGTLVGTFAATNNLKSTWELTYDGTVDNPDSVVLIAPAGGMIVLLR